MLIGAQAIYSYINPLPYSDSEIKASIVDTWQVSAMITWFLILFLVFLFVITLICLAMGNKKIKILGIIVLMICFVSTGLQFYTYAEFTKYVSELTGQSFSPHNIDQDQIQATR